MTPFKRIMVGLARSAADRALLEYARLLAVRLPDAEFLFVHVLGPPSPRRSRHNVIVTHEQALGELRQEIALHFGLDCAVAQTQVLTGVRVDSLLEFAASRTCDVILVGHRQAMSGRRSLARRLAMSAPCSVWMVPEAAPVRIERVMAAIDFSEGSALALSTAAWIARQNGLPECLALHVSSNSAVATFEEYDTVARDSVQDAFSRFSAPLDLHRIPTKPFFEDSASVSNAVHRVAAVEGVDLLVVGTRGMTRSAAVLLGSEAEQVIVDSLIPVLVAKRRGERIGLLQTLLDRDFSLPTVARFR